MKINKWLIVVIMSLMWTLLHLFAIPKGQDSIWYWEVGVIMFIEQVVVFVLTFAVIHAFEGKNEVKQPDVK